MNTVEDLKLKILKQFAMDNHPIHLLALSSDGYRDYNKNTKIGISEHDLMMDIEWDSKTGKFNINFSPLVDELDPLNDLSNAKNRFVKQSYFIEEMKISKNLLTVDISKYELVQKNFDFNTIIIISQPSAALTYDTSKHQVLVRGCRLLQGFNDFYKSVKSRRIGLFQPYRITKEDEDAICLLAQRDVPHQEKLELLKYKFVEGERRIRSVSEALYEFSKSVNAESVRL